MTVICRDNTQKAPENDPLTSTRRGAEQPNPSSPRGKRSIPVLSLSQSEAAEALGVSVDFFKQHVAPDLKVVRVGRRKLVSVRELERWLDSNAFRAIGDEA
jgi:hypothetical protein